MTTFVTKRYCCGNATVENTAGPLGKNADINSTNHVVETVRRLMRAAYGIGVGAHLSENAQHLLCTFALRKGNVFMSLNSAALTFIFVLIGTALRLVWPGDMEWKADEIWMFENSVAIAQGLKAWPAVGLKSGPGLVNPGLSVWVFVPLAKIFSTPVALVRGVQLLNVSTLFAYFLFIRIVIPRDKREIWYGGLMLYAVAPFAIILSRKIWAQCVLPPFVFMVFFAHWFRRYWAGAFGWGLVGALLGQIHLSGFFLAAALFVCTLLSATKPRLVPFILGSALGAIPLIPWVQALLATGPIAVRKSSSIFNVDFLKMWLKTGFPSDLTYSLGSAFRDTFLKLPVVLDQQTMLASGLTFVLSLSCVAVFARFLLRRERVRAVKFMREHADLNFYLRVCFWGVGLIMTFARTDIRLHYLIVLYPFVFFWVMAQFYNRPKIQLGIVLINLALSTMLLHHLHQNCGEPRGDYGTSYRCQKDF
jgi:hypothetical protein